ncbi:Histidine kinase-, DNA gyrase B-, and HSP90-like ATPase [Desulfotomaculum arcticum]|uniref:histidine kinase n=1 Tax=Desulfotruncus arcticus DSM 17038 TaxID=1121424 RepID=A0A1I2TXY8_9FIRM|nr:ATP-binding protein [Desulfotruncus arcticus]SFG69730.1 Histidine kinase-, DNA gyrase B-, and HSP90-like ATPase [Desulfotomaculum arcticum] [Desulfotruncus arcticus DSM 17038]
MEELSQHLLDVAVNSLEAGATELTININENIPANTLQIEVADNGPGISRADVAKVKDPFYTTKHNKRVGLGIPLFMEAVERCCGSFEIKAQPRQGTVVTATFPHNHLDRAPLGDVAGTLVTLLAANDSIDFFYNHLYNNRSFSFNTRDFRVLLRDIPIKTPEIMVWLKNYLHNNILKLRRERKVEEFRRTG